MTVLTGLSHLTFCRNSNIPLWQPLSSILYFVPGRNAKNITFAIQPAAHTIEEGRGKQIFPDNCLIINWRQHSWRLGQVGVGDDDKAKFKSNVTLVHGVQVPQLDRRVGKMEMIWISFKDVKMQKPLMAYQVCMYRNITSWVLSSISAGCLVLSYDNLYYL